MIQYAGKYHVSSTLSEITTTSEGPANFEEAISATEYGKFNIILILLFAVCVWASSISSTNISYIIPDLKCDLSLTLIETGILNASPLAGFICSAILWGYLSDIYGRRNVIIYVSLADAFVTVLCASVHSTWMLIFFKFLSGFLVHGPLAALMTYIAECHAVKYRDTNMLYSGIFTMASTMIIPLLAFLISPIPDIQIYNYVIRSWQIYILLCGIPSLVGGLTFILMPESPKYLLANQKYDEVLEVLQYIFKVNTGKPLRLYPITDLRKSTDMEENTTTKKSTYEELVDGFNQVKPIFYPPHLWKLLILTTMEFMIIFGVDTLRLWLPLILLFLGNYIEEFGEDNVGTICEIINYEMIKPVNVPSDEIDSCVADNTGTYTKLIMVGAFGTLLVSISTFIFNKFSKTKMFFITYITAAISGVALIWSNSGLLISIFSTIYICQCLVAMAGIFTLVIETFPTEFRTTSIALTIMTGRIGAVIGNLIFPTLLESGCYPPFILLSSAIFVCIPLHALFIYLKKE